MGQKINPTGFRTGVIFPTKSVWFSSFKDYSKNVLEEFRIRKFLSKKLALAGLTKVEIKRSINTIDIFLHVSRPGVVIGRGGSGLDQLKKEMTTLILGERAPKAKINLVKINLHPIEVTQPEISAVLVADRLANQLEHRYPTRRAVTQAIEKVMAAGAKGIKITLSGRINGAEISRREKYKQGQIPTQTLRANIDYCEQPALTRSGYVGIKVWIYTGEVIA
uniref:30S ribosomal protein S3 n=1 Tax=uncultured organism TaxID=155900 RepID=U3GW66_9ZZZZ|nr:30S ribosomal protein S3 [uncultured organism]